MSIRPILLSITCLGLVLLVMYSPADQPKKLPQPPLTTTQAQAAFRLAPGCRVELVAAEPEVLDPVAFSFAADGKLWVVEMGDYPNGPAPGKPPRGRIRILEDRDGNGRFETASTFAEGLLFANGLLPWKDGVIVTMAPHIVWLRDTDGDGKADKREVLYQGFVAKNPQLRVSHPRLGLDGWVYVANGLRGGKVRRAAQPESKTIDISGKDFRFDLLGGRAEALSGMGQFGNTFDDWGKRFVCDNRHHLRHVVFPDRYLDRNPYLAVPRVLEDISVLEGGQLSSGGKVYPISKNWTTSNLHAGRFTAACSVFIYRSGLLGKEFQQAAYTCDPTGNLIHREILRPHGATFRSQPARKGVEFLATPDDWCRPVFLTEGPDGAIYFADMYRAVIEHPQFMPTELKNRPDLNLAKDRGRIWRIVPTDHKQPPPRPALHKASTPELVKYLAHRDAWWRTTAHRLLLERQDRAARAPLLALCSLPNPRARVHAAWLLQRLDALEDRTLLKLLGDKHPRVREQAVLLAESRLARSPELRKRVLSLALDPDAQVRFQVALTLGEWQDDQIVQLLARIALAGASDPWTRTAVASAVPTRTGSLIATLVRMGLLTKDPTAGRLALVHELTALAGGRRDKKEIAQVLETLFTASAKDAQRWRRVGLHGLAEGMGRRGGRLDAFLKSLPQEKKEVIQRARQLLANSARVAQDKDRPTTERIEAIQLLAHGDYANAGPALRALLTPTEPRSIRLEAVHALADHNSPEVATVLLTSWRAYSPAMRRAVTDTLLRRTTWTRALLKEMQAGRVKPGDIDTVRSRRLLRHRQTDIRTLAGKLLRGNLPADRKKVLARYQAALKRKGDPNKGRMVFQKQCATCHRVAGVGVEVGPAISDTRTRTPAALLADILNPNQAIDNNYVSYIVDTKRGKRLTGIITTETASSITLRRAEGMMDVVLRRDIDQITSSGTSLMPEGLEKNITIAEMADLLAFLKNWRYLDGTVPVGK